MQELRGKRRFGVRPQAARINRTFHGFRASSRRGFTVRRGGKASRVALLTVFTLSTLFALWSVSFLVSGKTGFGPSTAQAAQTARAD